MRRIACGIVGTLLVTGSAFAQEPLGRTGTVGRASLRSALRSAMVAQAPDPMPDAAPVVSVSGGVDFPSTYFFRGIRQESDPELTLQPFVDIGFAVSDAVSVNVGTWNSVHTGSNPEFYESDLYAAIGVSAEKVSTTVMYTAYTSPDDAFGTVHELAFSLGIDDSESAVAMSPSVTVAFELGDNAADGGTKGVYLELGVEPGIPMEDSAVSLSVPVKLGLSLNDYYEGPSGDSKFGYIMVGLMFGVQVSDNVDVHGGLQVFGFGDTLKAINNDKAGQVVGTVGLGFGF